MHAFLIIADSPDKHISSLLGAHSAKRLDAIIHTIDDARIITKQMGLTLNEKTAIILKDFASATPEAQNALLKLIEEPQQNLLFILTSTGEEGILPTILSRVELIFDKKDKSTLESDTTFLQLSAGEKLTKTTKIKTREEAISFVEVLMQSAHQMFLEKNISPESMEAIAKTHNYLKRNGNIQLQLTHLVTQLS